MEIFINKERKIKELEKLHGICTNWYRTIENAGDDLSLILLLHKELWKNGLHHPNFGPNKYGMFRTTDIETMKPEEVYLGDVYGIWTNNIPFFEQAQIKYDDQNRTTDTYKIVCKQYKNHLASNIRAMESQIFDGGYSRERICAQLSKDICTLTEAMPSYIKINNRRIEDNKILTVTFCDRNGKKESDILVYNGNIYYPYDIAIGVKLNPKHIDETDLCLLGSPGDISCIQPMCRIKWDKDPDTLTRKDVKELRKNIKKLNEEGKTYQNLN